MSGPTKEDLITDLAEAQANLLKIEQAFNDSVDSYEAQIENHESEISDKCATINSLRDAVSDLDQINDALEAEKRGLAEGLRIATMAAQVGTYDLLQRIGHRDGYQAAP